MHGDPDSWWLEETIHAGREHFEHSDSVFARYVCRKR